MRCRAVVARRHDDRTPVRIQEHFAGVEPAALQWIEGAVHAEGVDLTCLQSGDEYVPVVIGTVGDRVKVHDTWRLRGIDVVEQQKIDAGAALREDRKVDAVGGERRAEWRAGAWMVGGQATAERRLDALRRKSGVHGAHQSRISSRYPLHSVERSC